MNEMSTAAAKKISAPAEQQVLEVHHWTDRLFSFTLTRPHDFRFRSGEFIMLGLRREDGKALLRAYSIASPAWEETLEFYSIKAPGGPLTSRLQNIQPGDKVLLGDKPTGTLIVDALRPGKRLFLFSTGTGVAPFASVIRDLETYEKFDQVILTHSCRAAAELGYSKQLVERTLTHEIIGETARGHLTYFNSLTREPHPRQGRITTLIETGALFESLGVETLNPHTDRAMICGSSEMTQEVKGLMIAAGLTEGATNKPAEFVIEKAFVG